MAHSGGAPIHENRRFRIRISGKEDSPEGERGRYTTKVLCVVCEKNFYGRWKFYQTTANAEYFIMHHIAEVLDSISRLDLTNVKIELYLTPAQLTFFFGMTHLAEPVRKSLVSCIEKGASIAVLTIQRAVPEKFAINPFTRVQPGESIEDAIKTLKALVE